MSRLSKSKVIEIREDYEHMRSLDDGLVGDERAEAWSPSQRDAEVADRHGVSASTVRRLVMGLTRRDAGGPIDNARRVRHELFYQERETMGEGVARARLRRRAANVDPDAVAPVPQTFVQRVTVVDRMGKPTSAVVDLHPGQSVRVELVAVVEP